MMFSLQVGIILMTLAIAQGIANVTHCEERTSRSAIKACQCSADQFTCGDGICIANDSKCDGKLKAAYTIFQALCNFKFYIVRDIT